MKKFKIKELGTVITGNTPSKKQKEYYESEDICFIKPDMILENNVWDITGSREYISEKARGKARIVKKGDILAYLYTNFEKFAEAEQLIHDAYAFSDEVVEPSKLIYEVIE